MIGAGPHGLATVAHLRGAGVDVRCFGDPLGFWRHHMPAGMILRSPVRATHIADPKRQLTIERFEQDTGRVVRRASLLLEEFTDYGAWFQQHVVPIWIAAASRKCGAVPHQVPAPRLDATARDVEKASHVVVCDWYRTFANGARRTASISLPRRLSRTRVDHETLAPFAGSSGAVIGGGDRARSSWRRF